jgi:carboxyl-terminal processing protease
LEDRADYWRRNVKYRILQEMISLVEKDDTLELIAENVLKMQEKAKDIRKHRFHRTFEKLLNNPSGLDNYLASVYLNTIANYYDPHSNYFSPTDMEQFNNSLSVNTRDYGIEFGENERGEVEVSALIPGGPAWKSGKIKEGDLLLKIVYDSVEVEISYLDIRGVNELIDQIGEKEVEFFLKQKSGEFISDRLNREEIKTEKNLVKHLILKGEKNIGYIMIPGFYMNGETLGEIGCSHDVARSVLKMQEDEVEGIILDLRFNGGGAMQEALDLSGIFIDQGPLGLYQEKDGKAHVMKDSHRGTVYNGPLIVLVNSVSASASELTAGVLQDYNRALIVGDQTYGKATAQVVYPLNSSLPIGNSNHTIDSGNGFIKITGAKFYRVSGVSHQKVGIIPDMKVCDVYSGLDYGEDNYQYALEADSSRTDVSYKKLALGNIESLRFKSEERLNENEDYKSIQDFITFYQERFNSSDSSYSINIHRMIRFYSEWNGIIQEVEQMGEGTSTHYTLSTISFDKDILAFDDYLKTTYEKLIEGINSDITLEEAYLIMLDFINQNQ